MEKQIVLKPFQDKYLFSEKRYPALVSAIATGKTYMLLLKLWRYCEKYPDSLALIVRKEYTNMRDSTLKDFNRYFGVEVDSNREYHFPNGSILMFRHGEELNVIKNVNLSIFGIEQAEEFDTEEQFTFLRDRLRRENAPYRQGCIIANAQGHNWIWQKWIYQPIEGSELITATTFDNEDNLPADFIADLKQMEKESPNHFKRYVLNSFEDVDADDLLLTGEMVYNSPKLEFNALGPKGRILGVDVARFGEDETVFSIVESKSFVNWELFYQDTYKNKDLMQTVGRIMSLVKEFNIEHVVIDDIGVGGGVTDRLQEMKINVYPFNSSEKAHNSEKYSNKRSEAYFKLQEMFSKGWLKIPDDPTLMAQLMSIRFKYNSDGRKAILSKDEIRKTGMHSPDRADALAMSLYIQDSINTQQYHNQPRYSRECNLFNIEQQPHSSRPRYSKEEPLF